MNQFFRRTASISAPLLLGALVIGCRSETAQTIPSEVVDKYQSQMLVADAPSGSKSVVEARQAIAESDDPTAGQQVALVGHIGGMPNPYQDANQYPEYPWVEQGGGFFLVDPATVEEFKKHGHAKGEECSFCLGLARDKADTAALVELRDAEGKPLEYPADQFLGLHEGDRLVVTGIAKLVAGTEMVVVAEKIHVVKDLPDTEAETAAE